MIQVDSLTKRFGSRTAVDALSFRVEPGEILGYLGPNGAGKTTTQRLLMGLLRPTSGHATIGGLDIVQQSREVRRITGFMPDTPFLYECMTARQFLAFVAEVHGLPADVALKGVMEVVDAFGLVDRLDGPLAGFSYGMTKKITLCALLAVQPRALLLDEPTTGMDPKSVKVMKDVVRDRAKSGTAILLSTHTLSVAEELCDRVAILRRGQIIALGTPEELQARGKSGAQDLEALFLELTEGEATATAEGAA